jgi:protein-S-isoprenylcysteine O-methyltransferase Ste14
MIDDTLGFEAINFGLTGTLIASIFLLVGGYYVLESIRVLLTKGGGIPLGDFFPEDQSSELITTGIYGQTRNPMLFGYLLCLISLGLTVRLVTTTFIVPTLFITIWTIWVKAHEEPALETRFGDPYREYRSKTPYLIPRLKKNN